MSSDLSVNLNMEKLLRDSESEELRREREAAELSMKPIQLQVASNEHVMAGVMLKKNKFMMK